MGPRACLYFFENRKISSPKRPDSPSGPSSLLFCGYRGSFHGNKPYWVWISPLTSIWCQPEITVTACNNYEYFYFLLSLSPVFRTITSSDLITEAAGFSETSKPAYQTKRLHSTQEVSFSQCPLWKPPSTQLRAYPLMWSTISRPSVKDVSSFHETRRFITSPVPLPTQT